MRVKSFGLSMKRSHGGDLAGHRAARYRAAIVKYPMALRATKPNEDAPQPRGAKSSGLPPGLESPLRGESILPGAELALPPVAPSGER